MLELLAEGLQNREIAERLEISPRTVEVYKAKMMEKLRCRNLADVVRFGDIARIGGKPKRRATRQPVCLVAFARDPRSRACPVSREGSGNARSAASLIACRLVGVVRA